MTQQAFYWDRTLVYLADKLTVILSELNGLESQNYKWRKFAGEPYHQVEVARNALILEICLGQSNFAEDVCHAIIYSDLNVESALNRQYRSDREDAFFFHEDWLEDERYQKMTSAERDAYSEYMQEKYADRG